MEELTQKPQFSECKPKSETPKKIENVGEEFMIWAEKGWAFERIVSKGLGDSEFESCPYPLYREYFINKINELVEQKIKSL